MQFELSHFYNQNYYTNYGGVKYEFETFKTYFGHKLNAVKKYCKEGRLLDVGCALGFFCKIAIDNGFEAYGVDFSEYAIRKAKNLIGNNRAFCIDIEKEKLPFSEAFFDVITMWDLLEHLKNPETQINKMGSLLRRDGLLFIITLNRNSFMARLMPNNWRAKSALHVSDYITPSLLRTWLRNAGLHVVAMSTFNLALKPFPGKLRRLSNAMRCPLTIAFKAVKPLNLGDDISCVARKV